MPFDYDVIYQFDDTDVTCNMALGGISVVSPSLQQTYFA
jgi:hypothetical protein